MLINRLFNLIALLFLVSLLGCEAGTPKEPPTPVESFMQQNDGTHTPHGRVIGKSATETETGDIQYRMEHGSTFQVTPSIGSDNHYRYTNPRKIEETASEIPDS